MAGGTITRKDLITDEGLEFGKEYAKNVELAIKANNELVDSAKALAKIANSYQKANNSQAFITAKNEEKLALQKVENAIKAEEIALKSAEKVKQEVLKTRKVELDAIAKEEAAKKRNTKLTVEERVQNEINNRVLKQAALEKLGLVSAYDKLNKSRTEAKNRLRDLIVSENASTDAIKKAQSEFDKLDKKVKKADDAVRDFTKNVGNYPTIGKFSSNLRDLAGAFGIVGGITAFVSVLKGAFETIKKFDQALADLSAITGATGKDLTYLKNQAIELGKATKGGAVQVVEAYKLIASAKPELLQNVEALNMVTESVLTLSKASGMELPDAATALTDAMNQFNASADESNRFIDALANGAKYGAAEIPQITEALLKFGAVAKSSNISIEESTALIELLAEKGLKGAEAGTALRNVLLKISAPDALPREAQKAILNLGISMDTLKDKTIPIQQKLEILKPILNDNAALVKIFGLENAVAARNVLENTTRLKELTSKMGEFGTAQEQANIRTNTLQGKTEKLSATYDSFILSLNNGKGVLSSFLSELADTFTFALEGLIRLNSSWDELYAKAQNSGKIQGAQVFTQRLSSFKYLEDEQSKVNQVYSIAEKNLESHNRAMNLLNKIQNDKDKVTVKEAGQIIKELNKYNGGSFKENDLREKILKSIATEEKVMELSKNKLSDLRKKENTDIQKTNETKRSLSKEEISRLKQEAAEKERLRKEELAKLKKFDDDSYALGKFRLEQEIEINNEIANNDSESIQDRLDAYLNAQQSEKALLEETASYKLRQISQYTDDVRDLTNEEIQTLIDGGKIKKKLTDDEVLVLEELKAKKDNLDKKDLANRQKILDSIVDLEQKKTEKVLQNQDTELNKRLTIENELYQENLKLLKDNQTEIEALTLKHEEEVFNIKKEFAKKALQEQINALQTILDAEAKKPESERISADKIAEIQNKLSKFKLQLSEEDLTNSQAVNQKRVELEKEAVDLIKQLQSELTSTLKDLLNSLFEAKIQRIDDEIQANDDYYNQQLQMAQGDADQQNLIEQERAKKRKELEKEKRKEELKAAIAQRIMATAQIGIDLAKTIMSINAAAAAMDAVTPFALGATGISYRAIQLPLAIGLSAAQTALVLSAPLPKYEKGTQGKPHKGGFAEVGEKRPEVILEPGRNPYVVEKPSILNLPKGTEVIPSIDEYQKMQRASIMASIDIELNKMNSYQSKHAFDARYNAELLEELKRNTEATKKHKTSNVVVKNNIDLGHEIWKLSNIKWNN